MFSNPCFSQNVVVSEYYNNSTSGDWIELLVVTDNADLRGYKLTDNGASQNSWQATLTFSNSNFWNNIRIGTIIIMWADSNSLFNLDLNKSDGYIELHGQLSGYTISSGGSSGGVINIGSNGEIIQLSNANNIHQHALANRSSVGNTFDTIPNNKLNHNSNTLSNDQSICVCPGSNLNSYLSYNTSTISYSGNDSTNKSNSTYPETPGLPNTCTNSSTANRNYWRSLRQPIYNSPTLNTITANSGFTQTNISWSACTDANPSDSTTGYIILRNTINSFTNPSDSIVYAIGSTIGTATVVTNINSSTTLAYNDIFAFTCGTTYYYKIYAFRFSADNNNISNAARGRAYNETGTNVQSIIKSYPLAQTIIPN